MMEAVDLAWKPYLRNVPLGTIAGPGGWSYRITWVDAMWAVRAVVGESAGSLLDGRGVVWAMINRHVQLRDQPMRRGPEGSGIPDQPPPRTLADVFLWYCQPINPYWRFRGNLDRQIRRQHFAAMTPSDPWMTQHEIANVLAVLCGVVPAGEFAGLVDFAQCDCDGCGRDTHGPEDLQLYNCFWSSPETADWNTDTVRVLRGSAMRRPNPLLAMTLGAAVVLGSVWIAREVM